MKNDLTGPMMPANTVKIMNEGVRQRYAVSVAGMREPAAPKKGKLSK